MFMNSILIAINVIRRLLREITSLGFIFLFPVIAAILATLMFGSPKSIEVAVANLPQQDYGLINFLEEDDRYSLHFINEKNVEESVNNNEVRYGIVFPDTINDTDKIKLVSKKNDEEAFKLKGTIDSYLTAVISGELIDIDKSVNKINDEVMQSKTAIGMMSMFIIMFIGTGMQLLLEDKRLKTFMRSFCAPLKQYELALGHLLANLFLGMIQIGIFLTISTTIFKFNYGTSIINVFIILLIFLITAIGLGIGMIGFINDSGKYNLILTTIAVSLSFIGGAFFPLEYMNDLLKKLANLTPQKWLIDAFVHLADGNSIFYAYTELAVLLLFGLVFFTFGVKSLKLTSTDL